MRQPAAFGGRLQHRVLAADLVREGRHAELLLHAPDDVEVRHAGLDHHHVGAFGEVERDLAQRLVGVRRVHLVDLLVALAEVGGRADGVAERTVEGARVLRAVRHDLGVDAAVALERAADRADAAVHHVARRDDVDAGGGLDQRLARQHRHRLVVEDVAGVVDQAVLAMRGVRIEGDVGHQRRARGSAPSARRRRAGSGLRGSAPRGRRRSSATARAPGTAPSPECRGARIPRRPAAGDRASGAARRASRRHPARGSGPRARRPAGSGR